MRRLCQLVCLPFLLLLWGCSDPNELILGKWIDKEGNTLEFHKDGSWESWPRYEPVPIWGTWRIDGETLKMRHGSPPNIHYERDEQFHFDDDKLYIKRMAKVRSVDYDKRETKDHIIITPIVEIKEEEVDVEFTRLEGEHPGKDLPALPTTPSRKNLPRVSADA